MEQIVIDKNSVLESAIETSAWLLYSKGDGVLIEDHSIHVEDSKEVLGSLQNLFLDIESSMYPLLRELDMIYFITSDERNIYVAIPDYVALGLANQSKPKDTLATILFDLFVTGAVSIWFEKRGEIVADVYKQVSDSANKKILDISKRCLELWHNKTKQDLWK